MKNHETTLDFYEVFDKIYHYYGVFDEMLIME